MLNELRDKFSKSKIKEIRNKIYVKQKIEPHFKELEKKNIFLRKKKTLKQYREKQEEIDSKRFKKEKD